MAERQLGDMGRHHSIHRCQRSAGDVPEDAADQMMTMIQQFLAERDA